MTRALVDIEETKEWDVGLYNTPESGVSQRTNRRVVWLWLVRISADLGLMSREAFIVNAWTLVTMDEKRRTSLVILSRIESRGCFLPSATRAKVVLQQRCATSIIHPALLWLAANSASTTSGVEHRMLPSLIVGPRAVE